MDKTDKYDDVGSNALDSPHDAWLRVMNLLEAHHKIADTLHHPFDAPGYAIERLITDLMHYAHERNKGKPVEGGEYIQFDRVVANAKQQFIRERETAIEQHEPLLDPELQVLREARSCPEYREIEEDLALRQFLEGLTLIGKQRNEVQNLGASPELEFQHRQEDAEQEKRFKEEKKRYASEFLEAKRLAQEMEQQEKGKALDLGKKFS